MRESARDGAHCFLNAFPLWELHLCESPKRLEPWLKRKASTKLGPQDTIRKVLECGCLKCPLIVHLDIICMSYDRKKGHKYNFLPQISLQQGSNNHQLGSVIQRWKDIFEGYKILFSHDSNMFDLKKIWASKFFGKAKVPILGLPLGSPKKKNHLNVDPKESQTKPQKTGKMGTTTSHINIRKIQQWKVLLVEVTIPIHKHAMTTPSFIK
jgi:hypothetical protein